MKSVAQEWQLMAIIRIVFLATPPSPLFCLQYFLPKLWKRRLEVIGSR